jgi:hypothetical protein
MGKRVLESAAGRPKPMTRKLEGNDARAFADAEAEKIGFFGTIVLFPANWKPGRWGLAGMLFEILSFQPRFIRTQVLAWGMDRKASKTFPIFR